MLKLPHLNGISIGGDGWTVTTFLITPRKMVKRPLVIEIQAPLGREKNDKDTFLTIIDFIGLKFGTLSVWIKKPPSFGRLDTKRWLLMSGGRALP